MTNSRSPIRHPSLADCSLVKLGGSLLTSPDLKQRLARNLSRLVRSPIVVVGGGGLTDVIRDWDQRHALPIADSDHLAIMTLSVTAEFIARLSGLAVVDNLEAAIQSLADGRIPVIDVPKVLASSGDRLPQGWHVTSDSIAASIAVRWGMGELILVKSTKCPCDMTFNAAAEAGLVDGYFSQAVISSLRVRWCDGRSEPWQAEDWQVP